MRTLFFVNHDKQMLTGKIKPFESVRVQAGKSTFKSGHFKRVRCPFYELDKRKL